MNEKHKYILNTIIIIFAIGFIYYLTSYIIDTFVATTIIQDIAIRQADSNGSVLAIAVSKTNISAIIDYITIFLLLIVISFRGYLFTKIKEKTHE